MKNPLYDLLNQCCEKKKIVSIFSDIDSVDCFNVGIICNVSEDWTIAVCVDDLGNDIGITAIRTELIYALQYDDTYTNSIKQIWNGENVYPLQLVDVSINPLHALFHLSCEKHKLISCEINNSGNWDVMGYVQSIDGDVISFIPIDDNGKQDGVLHFCSAVLTRVEMFPARKKGCHKSSIISFPKKK